MIDRSRLLQTFLALVSIDSPSGHEEAFARDLARRLESLGAEVRRDAFGNVIARIGGTGSPFLLGTHMDTVEPGRGVKPQVRDGVIRSDGTTVLGGDPKAGVAAILEGLAAAVDAGLTLPSLELVFTRSEESGLEGSANLDYSLLTARNGVELDGEGPVYRITTEAPGRISARLTFTGRGAHAGVEPEKGISAIRMAARFVQTFPQGRIDHETTANIGLIEGGTAANAVPETAAITAEARSRDPEKLKGLQGAIRKLAASIEAEFPGGAVACDIRNEFSAYKLGGDHPTVRTVSAALDRCGLRPELIASGGATDANNYALHGIDVAVVGLGGEDFHTLRESVPVANLVDAARFCYALLETLPR